MRAILALALAAAAACAKKHPTPAPSVQAVPVVSIPNAFPAGLAFCGNAMVVSDLASNTVWSVRGWGTNATVTAPIYQFPDAPNLNMGFGILGVTCNPALPLGTVFVYFNAQNVSNVLYNRIYKLTLGSKGKWTAAKLWQANTPAGFDNGGKLGYNPADGLLYLSVGEGDDPSFSQNKTANAGKIVRLTVAGQVPASNPWPHNFAISYGHRNPFGFDWDASGQLWASEDGPSCNDEINRIELGHNYGWGAKSFALNGDESKACVGKAPFNTNLDGTNVTLPVWYFPANTKTSFGVRPPAVTGLAICKGCGVSGLEGKGLLGTFNAAKLYVVDFTKVPATPTLVSKPVVAHDNKGVSILVVERGIDNAIYFSDASGRIYKVAA